LASVKAHPTQDSPSHSKTNRHLSIWKKALVLCETRSNLQKTLQIGDCLGLARSIWAQKDGGGDRSFFRNGKERAIASTPNLELQLPAE
jgi:hypothetical protein